MILDLFAGPGGWSCGLRAIGLEDVGLEWDRDACRTRAAAGHKTIRCDVSQYPVEPFVGKVRGLIASPPCQAFSMAGKRLGMQDLAKIHAAVEASRSGWRDELRDGPWADPRSALILEPLRWAWSLKPEWVACEQVPPALPVWEHMADVLRSWGYDALAVRLLAADYGVPQTRLRAFLLAHRTRVNVPTPTHSKHPWADDLFGETMLPWVSMAEALGWVPGDRAWDRRTGGKALGLAAVGDDRPAPTVTVSGKPEWSLVNGNQRNAAVRPAPAPAPAPAIAFGHNATGVKWTVRDSRGGGHGRSAEFATDGPSRCVGEKARSWLRVGNQEHSAARPADEPAPTLRFSERKNAADWFAERPATTICNEIVSGPGHRDMGPNGVHRQDAPGSISISISISISEAAVLQSFPADYPFRGSKTAQFRQVGDAVCPRLAAHILAALSHTQEV